MKITDEEYNQIIAEMTKRLRDIMYIYSDKKLRKEIPKKLAEELLEGEGILEITYDFHFAVADLKQCLGRLRRLEKEV